MIPITPAPTVMVATYFGYAMPVGTDVVFEVLIIIASFSALMYFGWEFARKWKLYREINKYVESEEEE